MKHFFFILTICFGILQAYAVKVTDPVDYVNPLMGTQSKFELSNGNTYPAIALPWGMNFWTPQTGKMGNGWVYTYDADKIRGFKQTHQPSPWINDYGQFSIMPLTGELVFDEEERASWFSHKAETVKPYYYSVYLADHDVVTEIVPTERAAMFRFTFPENDDSYIIMDAFDKGSEVKIFPEENKIMGYTTKNNGGVPDNFKNYFVVQFDKPFTYKASVLNKKIMPDVPGIRGDHTGAIIGFSTKKGEKIHAKVTSSFISYEQAEQNFRELNNDFDGLKDAARQTWNDILGRILIEDDNLDNIRTFYSTLYRSVLFPRKLYEIDPSGNIVHYSPYNGKIEKGYMFTDTGFWDTFRCLFPFLNLMYPSMNEQMQEGLVNTYKESGFLPEWASPGHRSCMVGNNSASVVADAYLKGLKGYDINILYEAVLHGTQNVHPKVKSTGRYGHEYYNELGYVPYDVKINENVARTLEYAYSDWAIYKLAKALSRPQSEIDLFAQRAMNYKNVFDAETKLMRGRNKDGSFQSPFNPLKWGDAFTEGNSWHYTWSVFHDPQGLIDLMGGKSVFNQMLDSIFNIPPLFDDSYYGKVIHEIREMQIMNMGNYAHGNQPIQHMIYLYNYSGEPWKAQYRTREVMNKLYSATPDGYCGDEDNGQTSAWYVFSALGFYPVCPGTDEYIVGSPLFKKATLYLENGKEMVLSSHNNHSSCPYINVLKVNGMEHTQNYFRHDQLTEGGNIDFYMSDKPNKQRGIEDKDLPYSFSREKDYTTKLKAITFNIRMDTPSDGVNSWSHRKENVIGMLKRMNGDVMGMQEVLFNQLQDLQNNLPGYSYIGVG
ncbi:MAG: GH92 family glycosyl hydrolase, partial [Bacteroidales bacterium]|nr:GH92 family glycosyl hydrolase [Bacteroidales bacterium]